MYGFDYLGFHHSANGISLSKKSLNLIMSNYYNYYKNYLKNSALYLSEYSQNKNKIWRRLSLAINRSIRGFNQNWKGNKTNTNDFYTKNFGKNVYGIARHLSIITNPKQIKLLEQWLANINKYFCYKICKTNGLTKTYIELESILNWYFRYKNNYHSAIQIAYSRYLENISPVSYHEDIEILEYLEMTRQKEEGNKKESYLDKDENEYIYIRGHDMIAMPDAGVYYDDISENWEPIPDDLHIS